MLLIFLDVARVCLRSPTLWTFPFSDLFIHFFLSVSTWKNGFSSLKCKDDVIVQIRDGSEGGGGFILSLMSCYSSSLLMIS